MKTLLETKIDFPCTVKVSQHENGTIMHEIIPENEFKEGDIIFASDHNDKHEAICIINYIDNEIMNGLYYHAMINFKHKLCCNGNMSSNWVEFRLATPAEQQLLLAALKKDGNRWNAKKKCIEDLPEEPKADDYVIVWSGDNYERSILGKRKDVLPYFSIIAGCKHIVKWDGTLQHLERVRNGEI